MLGDRDLSVVNAVFFLSVVGMNVFGLFVTSRLGSVFRAVLLTARTASVGGAALATQPCRRPMSPDSGGCRFLKHYPSNAMMRQSMSAEPLAVPRGPVDGVQLMNVALV